MTTFNTHAEMAAAGYTRGHRIHYRGFSILPVDTSGPRCFGYSYAVGLDADDILSWEQEREHESHFHLTGRHFGSTVDVWLAQEKNRVDTLGCFAVRFAPAVWADGVKQAKAAVDAWLAQNPMAAAIVADAEKWRAEVTARQEARAKRREAVKLDKLVASWGAQA